MLERWWHPAYRELADRGRDRVLSASGLFGTPHATTRVDVSLDCEDFPVALERRQLGAGRLWCFRGSFGILDSNRSDVGLRKTGAATNSTGGMLELLRSSEGL